MSTSSATRTHRDSEAELPPSCLAGPGGPLTLRRCWPLPEGKQDTAQLAVELTGDEVLRAGWWNQDGMQLLDVGDDPVLTDLKDILGRTGDDWGAELVSHRPGKRAVVRRAAPSSEQQSTAEFVKVVKPGRAGRILDGIDRAAPFAGPFRTPEVLSQTDSTVTFASLEGLSLHSAADFSREDWTQAWGEVCQAMTLATSIPNPHSASALVHRAESEIAVLRHWFTLTRRYLSDAEQAAHKLETLIQQLSDLPADRLVPSHRDLHDKQLLWSAQLGPALLDVDTACLADPALDLGNLRAHAQLRRMQGVWSRQEAETVRFSVDEAAEYAAVSRSSVAVYERAALLRLGMVYAVRPQYAATAAELRQLL